MICTGCEKSSEGYAVIPGIGELGQIRFFCDSCARRDRVKMRYWDGRDLEVGGWREDPDLGEHYHTLIFMFDDLGRMRSDDLVTLMEWVEDETLACALVGADARLLHTILQALPRDRAIRVRSRLKSTPDGHATEAARKKIGNMVRRL